MEFIAFRASIFQVYPTKMILDRGKPFLECYQKKENLTFSKNKEIHNGYAKMQKYIAAGSIEGSANLKLKKISLSKLSLLQDDTEENARTGVLGSYFCLQVIENIASK